MKTHNPFKFVLLLVLLVAAGGFGQQAMAQEDNYHPFADNAVWSVNNIKYATSGDTTICGKNYLKVYRQKEDHPFDFDVEQADYFCAIRNDTAAQRVYGVNKEASTVYYYIPDTPGLLSFVSTDTTEFLLYDFSLESDDTATIASFDDIYNTYAHPGIYLYMVSPFYIEYDYEITLNDSSTRRVKSMRILNVSYYNDDFEWIEGIGNTFGTFTVGKGGFYDVWESSFLELICYEQEEELLLSRPQSDYDGLEDCFSLGYVSIVDGDFQEGHIYPNPTTGKLTISLPESWGRKASQVSVYNANGQRVISQTAHTQIFEISLYDLPSGMYIMQIIGDNKLAISKKIIKR